MPSLSVIMGIYNTNDERVVKESIDSILNQTYTDFEFIICDDGSTDETYELLKKLTHHDSRVILLRNSVNKGLAATLNTCLEKAKGNFIARMDADDISLPSRFERQIEFLKNNHEYDLVGCNSILFDEKGNWGERITIEFPDHKSFLFGTPFIHPTIMVRKSIMRDLGGYRVQKETLRCEDYDLFMRLYIINKKGYNIQENLFKFRENQDAYNRRKYKYRFDEARVRVKGFKGLGLMPKGLLYALKPLIVGIIPQKILAVLRRERTMG